MSDLRSWIINRASDFRVTRSIVDGRRELVGHLTINGQLQSIGPFSGESADDDVEKACAKALYEALGMAAANAPTLAQEIVRASLAGDEATRIALTAQYLEGGNAVSPARPRTRWSS